MYEKRIKRGDGMYPKILTDLDIIHGNTKNIVSICGNEGIEVMGITKGFCAAPEIARVMVEGGIKAIGDSRLKNLQSLKEQGIDSVPLWLLRIPMHSELEWAARLVDGVFLSEISTAEKLSMEAEKVGRKIEVVLMVEMGDLREGVIQENLLVTAKRFAELPGLSLQGLGANFACFGGVIPTYEILEQMVKLTEALRKELNLPLPIVSGGNSSSVGLLPGDIPKGITQLRLGEAILFGQEATERRPILGSSQNAFTLMAEVIELQVKPTMPTGKIGIDAFGKVPVHVDRGIRKRAIVAVGRQDTVPEDLFPLWQGVEILGSSSDHMILDVEDATPAVKMGDVIPFRIRYYSAMLQGFTSAYVTREFEEV